jgi:hypothetical protein
MRFFHELSPLLLGTRYGRLYHQQATGRRKAEGGRKKAKGKRQKARGERREAENTYLTDLSTFTFYLLPFALISPPCLKN